MLYQLRTWGVSIVGVLIAGMLIGSWLADTSVLWWLIVGLGIIAFGGGLVLTAVDRGRSRSQKPLARV